MKTGGKSRAEALALGFSALVPFCLASGARRTTTSELDGNVLLQADEAVYDPTSRSSSRKAMSRSTMTGASCWPTRSPTTRTPTW